MEWVTGVKLTGLAPEEIRRLVAAGQEAFLTQLLEVGFFHGDPHPGNLLKVGCASASAYCLKMTPCAPGSTQSLCQESLQTVF